MIFVDEKGEVVDGDRAMGILAIYLKENGRLKNNALVVTVMSNWGLHLAMQKEGIQVIKVPVGDRHVLEGMLENDIVLGGEQSGHIVFSEYGMTGDGMLTALQMLKVMKEKGKPLSELALCMQTLPQILLNVPIRKKVQWEELPRLQARLKEIERELGTSGRVLLRYSGTEPLARIMVEGRDREKITRMANDLSGKIKEAIGRDEDA